MASHESATPRVSYERLAVDAAAVQLATMPGIEFHRGQGGSNKFSIPGWNTSTSQAFQFGDLRIETRAATVVVEYESAAGLTNLVKYWPLLTSEEEHAKRFVIVHVFQVGSPGDYLSHRLLWEFMVKRMTVDLSERGLQRPLHWEAKLFTYHRGEVAQDAIDFIRANI